MKSKRVWLSLLFVGLLLAMPMLGGCAEEQSTATPAPTAPVTSTPAPTTSTPSPTATSTPSPELSGSITEAGSTTVQPLAEKMAAGFMAKHPKVKITIQGGGSSTGVKSCANGVVNIGAASRDLKSSEPALVTHCIARDGIAIVVHSSNPVSGLTKEQVKDIFAGSITNWKDVGGDDAAITVVSREEGSGTRSAFEHMIMGKKGPPITNSAIFQPSNGVVKTTVAGTPLSIGYLSLGYLDATIKALDIDSVPCTVENAACGKYPVVRPLYFLTKEAPKGLVKEFLDFAMSSDGQKIVEEEGYISIK